MKTIPTTDLPEDLQGTYVEDVLTEQTFMWFRRRVALFPASYHNGRLAIEVRYADDHRFVAELTMNVPDAELNEGEIFVQPPSAIATLAEAALAAGLFVDTRRGVSAGTGYALVWKVPDPRR